MELYQALDSIRFVWLVNFWVYRDDRVIYTLIMIMLLTP